MRSIVRMLIIFASVGHLVTQDDSGEDDGNSIDDMILSPEQEELLESEEALRIVYRDDKYRWPKGKIPYFLDPQFTEEQIRNLQAAMKLIENESCVRFVKVESYANPAVSITANPGGCYSELGFNNKVQVLNLNAKCLQRQDKMLHELLHTVGFLHQHNAPNRDDYIRILWNNVIEDQKKNFKKYSANMVTELGYPYDYNSIMHYKDYYLGKNKMKTIEALDGVTEVGMIGHMTATDIAKLKKMYANIC